MSTHRDGDLELVITGGLWPAPLDADGFDVSHSSYGARMWSVTHAKSPSQIVLVLDSDELLPRSLVEKSHEGATLASVEFEGWLDVDGRPVPKRISVKLPEGSRETCTLVYDFAVHGDVWLLEGLLSGHTDPARWVESCVVTVSRSSHEPNLDRDADADLKGL